MTTVRGRAVIDFLRFELRLARFFPANPYASAAWWDDVYRRYSCERFEWGCEFDLRKGEERVRENKWMSAHKSCSASSVTVPTSSSR